MSDQTEIKYLDGDIVWVKLGSCWWPGEVVGPDRLPPDVMPSFKKPPIAVVKFFQESTYEYVKNTNSIFKYDCSRKAEFINKGLYMYRTKHGHMEKFPEDVIRAETAVGGDKEILTRDEFQEVKKESYAGIFGDAKKTPGSGKRGRGGRGKSVESTPTRNSFREKTDYKVHILLQTPKECIKSTGDSETSPSTSRAGSEPSEDKPQALEPPSPAVSTPSVSNSGIYACHSCNFSTSRLNVLILHNKTHSSTFIPYTPSPVRKKSPVKPAKSTPKISTPKTSRPRKEKIEKPKKEKQSKKRVSEEKPEVEVKKPKTDQEIKSSLLADWDDGDEDTNDESAVVSGSPEEAVAAESPALPVQPDIVSAQIPLESSSTSPEKKVEESATEKPESSSDCKYEFCEDEDWPVEAGVGRMIPRVKNPSKNEKKSISIDDEEMAKEVAELLTKTAVPELPSIPEPLKAEENFPEPPVIKSPDKVEDEKKSPDKVTGNKSTKAIFKTKTFFRSRHSRSQDAIGKYVAEQLNAAERMDISECDLNGSEVTSSPEARESPPVDNVKVARLAPKIQLKKMKAEAAQLREKEKSGIDQLIECTLVATTENVVTGHIEMENDSNKSLQDVLYPTQEIKPINKDVPDKIINNDNNFNSPKSESSLLTNQLTREKSLEKSPKKLKTTETLTKANDIGSREISSSIEHFNKTGEESNEICVPEASQYVKELDRKTLNQQNEITSSIPNKPIEQSQEISSSKKTEASPIKKYEQSKEISSSSLKYTEPTVQKLLENMIKPYMNESTASAVDALLSVSREADRVPKVVSNDLPEDLFEDDKDNGLSNDNLNGMSIDTNIQHDLTDACKSDHADEEKNIIHNIAYTSEAPNVSNQYIATEKMETEVIETEISIDSVPSESDLQIAETLINLPASTVKNKANDVQDSDMLQINVESEPFTEEIIATPAEEPVVDNNIQEEAQVKIPESFNNLSTSQVSNDGLNIRYETEQEKCENLNAAQSLVQMSESMDHTVNVEKPEVNKMTLLNTGVFHKNQNNGIDIISDKTIVPIISNDNSSQAKPKMETSSKLLKMLEEPSTLKSPIKTTTLKIIPGKEKILNFDVAKSSLKGKTQAPKQKIIIRRAPNQKTIINNLSEVIGSPDKIILSRNSSSQDGSSVQTFTIKTAPNVQTSTDVNPKQIIIQPKIRKVTKTVTKLQKIKPQNSLIQMKEQKNLNESQISLQSSSSLDDPMFDINSMPVVLSDEILTPESIEKMPIVMSDGNIISSPAPTNIPPPKLIKTKPTIIENERVAISALPNKPELKKLIVTSSNESNKVTTPNILSKSSKLRGKPMLVFDKVTGKQKIIMTKSEPVVKEVKPAQTLLQPVVQSPTKNEGKFIILPSNNSPRPAGRTQKIVIDPQTGKAHVLVTKGQEPPINASDNKPVSAKLIPSSSDPGNAPGNTVMIITNAQGTQSRIVLTPEHEKILFPNKQPNVTQLKALTQRITTNTAPVQKTIISAASPQKTIVTAASPQKTIVAAASPANTQTRIVPKQKNAIITSKGQLIVGGRVTTTAHNIAPKPDIRPAPKRIIASEPKKLVQAIQKTSSEPLIFLQQKSGAVMQLTAAQFEHLQKTGQIVQKPAPAPENKIVVQKSMTISPKETLKPVIQKQRARKIISESSTPSKKAKHEIAIAPAPILQSCLPPPPLAAFSTSSTPTVTISSIIPTVSVSTSNYPELENFEELLPSTAIAKQTETIISRPPELVENPLPQPEVVEQVASQEIVQESDPVAEPPPGQLSDGQLLAVPGESFGGPPGSFYLCVEDNGTLTPIDNRPLVLENNQLVPMAETVPMFTQQPERRDILEAALANSDVFQAEAPRNEAPDFRDLNANVSVHCRVSETSTVLNQPIMTPLEVPSKGDSEATVPSNLEDGLAVIGVTPHTVPTSLELPITVTDPRIAKTTDPLCNTTYTTFMPSPSLDMSFESTEEVVTCGSISMPLLTDEECVGGKSMPILTEEVAVSSVESLDSPQSLEALEARDDPEDAAWSRRLLTPNSDTSETSSEIPLQPHIQLSVNDISRHN